MAEAFRPESRWFRPGHVSDYERRLAAGEPLLVDSATLWSALFRAGLPNAEFGRDGVFHGMYRHISEAGEVTEWTVEDSIEYGIDDPRIEREPGKHCKGGRTCQRCDPRRGYSGGAHDKSSFLLDERDQLTEYVEADSD